jgi:hypothetical protein
MNFPGKNRVFRQKAGLFGLCRERAELYTPCQDLTSKDVLFSGCLIT